LQNHTPLPAGLEQLRIWVMNGCAVMLVLTPPLVWFGHTQAIISSVLGAGLFAGVLYCFLHRYEVPPTHYKQPGPPRIPDAFFEELTNLGTLNNNHCLSVDPLIRARMNRLRRLVEDKRMWRQSMDI
jgi:hypothetical protein